MNNQASLYKLHVLLYFLFYWDLKKINPKLVLAISIEKRYQIMSMISVIYMLAYVYCFINKMPHLKITQITFIWKNHS